MLKASILFIAVSKAVMDSRNAWSCSHSGLLRRSVEIFTAALDMADNHQKVENTVKTYFSNFVQRLRLEASDRCKYLRESKLLVILNLDKRTEKKNTR